MGEVISYALSTLDQNSVSLGFYNTFPDSLDILVCSVSGTSVILRLMSHILPYQHSFSTIISSFS